MAFSGTDTPNTAILINAAGLLTATPFSAMLWVRMTVANTGTPMGIWSLSADGQRAWRLRINADPSPRAELSFDGTVSNSVAATSTLTLNVWFHVGMDFDGSTSRILVNGVVENTSSFSGTVFASSRTLGIGAYDDVAPGTASELDGDIEDMRYYDRILTLNEWATINRVRGLDGIKHGLVTQWPINERSNGTVIVTADPKDVGPAQLSVNTVVGSPPYVTGELRDRRAA